MEIFKRSDHPNPRSLDGRLARGALVALYPGILVPAAQPITLNVLTEAARLVDPDVIIVGEGARLLGWAAQEAVDAGREFSMPSPLEVATVRQSRGESGHLKFVQRRVPESFIVDRGALRFTTPELTAVDLIPQRGAEVVDEVLRLAGSKSAASLALMWEAFSSTPGRRGNRHRHRILHSSRDRPWSQAERQLHGFLRSWGYSGWVANHHVYLGKQHWFIDVAFPKQRVALEFDSREFHSGADAFERDREKLNELEVADWRTLQITWKLMQNPARIRRWLRVILPPTE
ncbi:hypothetical protein AADG42_04830 [Ammonicoccus fulvus]|uniref:DUF559 domain-containing protein n=1 Tax=Ammonicoccus fulvus TaxID=3138240 RepID=A0ABZ3FKT4_9ACTN